MPKRHDSPGQRMLESVVPPTRDTRLYRVVADRLREIIRCEPNPAGARLPSQREMAARLNVSRSSVREALVELELAGEIEVRGGSGVYVAKVPAAGAGGAQMGHGPAEVLATRRMIEPEVAALAARVATDRAIDMILAAAVAREGPDRDFHLAIALAANNGVLYGLLARLLARPGPARRPITPIPACARPRRRTTAPSPLPSRGATPPQPAAQCVRTWNARQQQTTEHRMKSKQIAALLGAAFPLFAALATAAWSGDVHASRDRIGLAHLDKRLNMQAGDSPQRFLVESMTKGVRPSGFVAASSAPSVASVALDGDTLVVTPRVPGQATITVSSADDDKVAVSVAAVVGPAFAVPDQAYALQGRTLPAAQARDVQIDTPLHLRFDAPPQLKDGGSVRIYRAADDALVDVIRAGTDVNEIGTTRDGMRRVVRYQPIEVSGADVTIRPHDARLAYDTDYYVLVDANLFGGATIGGLPFTGIGKRAGWTFRTRAHMPTGATLTVDDDGPADFRTVQGALNHAMRNLPREQAVTIRVANGHYGDLLYLRGKDKVTLRGESREGAVISVENGNGLNPGAGGGQAQSAPGIAGGRAVFLVEDADMLRLDKLSIVSTGWRSKPTGGQAETLYFNSDGRMIATNSDFISEQDTILVRGWSWFYHSLIAGNVDFIWGYNHATLFEEDEIRSLGDSTSATKGGYIVQARTVGTDDPGFVFLNSRLTHGPGPAGNDVPPGSSFLARPGTLDKVSYIDCRMDRHISPRGWSGKPHGGAGWYEFNSMDLDGKPLDLSGRTGGQPLSAAQAERFSSRARVFAGFDQGKGWMPSSDDAK